MSEIAILQQLRKRTPYFVWPVRSTRPSLCRISAIATPPTHASLTTLPLLSLQKSVPLTRQTPSDSDAVNGRSDSMTFLPYTLVSAFSARLTAVGASGTLTDVIVVSVV